MITKGKEVKERRMDNSYKFDSLLKVETQEDEWRSVFKRSPKQVLKKNKKN